MPFIRKNIKRNPKKSSTSFVADILVSELRCLPLIWTCAHLVSLSILMIINKNNDDGGDNDDDLEK